MEYLPPNATSHLQPLDAGILKNVEHFYRKWIVRRSLAMVERGDTLTKLSILDEMHFLATAWDSSATTVQHYFRKCGFQSAGQVQALTEEEDAEDSQEMEDAMAQMGAPITYCEYASLDDNVVTSEPQSIADIVADLTLPTTKKVMKMSSKKRTMTLRPRLRTLSLFWTRSAAT